LRKRHHAKLFAATKLPDAKISAIPRDDPLETGPRDEVHYLRKQRPPCVHDKASRPKQPGELQPNRQTDFKSTPSKIARNLLAYNRDSIDQSRLTGQQWCGIPADVRL
jgi:hypothetical protein